MNAQSKEDEPPVVEIHKDGTIATTSDRAAQLLGFDSTELVGMNFSDILANGHIEHGRNFERILRGETVKSEVQIVGGGGKVYTIETHAEVNDRDVVEVEFEVVNQNAPLKKDDGLTDDFLDGISDYELNERAENIRINGPEGPMSLKEIVMDLMVGHTEIDNYKKGALTLTNAIDSRIVEEEQRNPDSVELQLLKEVKRDLFGLYLRVQRGDEELFGERNGKYSGYFDASEANADT